MLTLPIVSLAQNTEQYSDPTKRSFRIVICDGPRLPDSTSQEIINLKEEYKKDLNGKEYIPCDFKGLMLQIQHLINIMMVLGVFVAIGVFTWAGYLYITGIKANIDKAHTIFPKVFFGFIIMLSAWFIVYQILSWLTNNPGFKTLLGS